MRIVGLMSSYREGRLPRLGIKSLLAAGCAPVVIFDGPFGNPPESGEPTHRWAKIDPGSNRVVFKTGQWLREADKRNEMLAFTRRFEAPLWGVFLDGDEVLMQPEFLPDWIAAAEARTPEIGGLTLRLVEMDGGVSRVSARVLRLDKLEAFLEGSYQVQPRGGGPVLVLPLEPEPREPWETAKLEQPGRLILPPPYPGEPYILHRASLRPPARFEHRVHVGEGDWWDERKAELLGT